MSSLHSIKKYRLVAYVQERKTATKYSIRQLAREAGVNNSTVERFLRNGCSDMIFKDAVPLLLLLGISPTQAADMLGMLGPLPQNKEEALIVDTAWKLSMLEETDKQAIIRLINQCFETGREEVS